MKANSDVRKAASPMRADGGRVGRTLELQHGEDEGPAPRSGDSPSTLRQDPLLGTCLLHYRVLDMIGQGGMSVVYRGRDERLQRDVAIKVLHPFLAEKQECRARLVREARAVARLEHPHILKVFDFSGASSELGPAAERSAVSDEGFIVAELVRGATLKRFAEQHALWQTPEAGAMVVWQLATALQHAHDHGVIHRDIKPENVMVRDDGCLKLMDFGIAHIADQKSLTITGTLLGSPAHMAPECIDGAEASRQSDVFSLGTVLYWLTTGALPFEANTPHALLKQIVEGRALPAQQRSPRISDDLARVIARAMATRPSERFADAASLAAALDDVLGRAGLVAEGERLRRVLAAPAEELPRVSTTVRTAFLRRAEDHLVSGAAARALACLNRVLAENHDDAAARALLERVQDGTEQDADDVETKEPGAATDPSVGDIPGLVQIPSPGDVAPMRGTVSPVAAGVDAGRVLRQAALMVVAVGLIGTAVAISDRFDDTRGRTDASGTTEALESSSPQGSAFVSATTSQSPTVAAPASATATAVPEAAPVLSVPRGGSSGSANTTPSVDPKTTAIPALGTEDRRERSAAPSAAAQPMVRAVVLRVKPWADMFVDGAPVATGKRAEVPMSVGSHVVVFRNIGAKDAEVRVDVPADGPVPEVAVELEPKPAYLAVRSNVPQAFVSVNGQGGKVAGETLDAPLLVPLGKESVARLEVVVHHSGYAAYVRRVEFIAGRTLQLDVELQPEAASLSRRVAPDVAPSVTAP